MKRPFRHSRRFAFTLVELLVVIAIIAILAGVIISSVSGALRFARRTKANSTASMIQTAVQSYYTEYSVYPTQAGYPNGTTDAYYDGISSGTGWRNLTIALLGNIDPLTGIAVPTASQIVANTRSISYLSVNHSDLDTTYGILKNPFSSSTAGTYAPYYYLAIDTDYSGVVGDTSPTKIPDFSKNSANYMGATLANGTPGGVAVWCSCDQPVGGGTTAKPSPPAFWAHTY